MRYTRQQQRKSNIIGGGIAFGVILMCVITALFTNC